jgi:hypothetical protein
MRETCPHPKSQLYHSRTRHSKQNNQNNQNIYPHQFMIFPKCQFWSCIPIGSPRSWSGSRKVAADCPWHHQDDWRCSPWKIQRVSGRFPWNQHAKFSDWNDLSSLTQPDTAWRIWSSLISWFPNLNQGGISWEVARVAARKKWLRANHAIQLVNYLPRWAPSADWVILSFFFSMDNNHNRHNQQKIIFFVYYQRLALTIFSCDRGQCLA